MIEPIQPTWALYGSSEFTTEALRVEGFVEVQTNSNVNFLPVVWWDGKFLTAHSLKIGEHGAFKGVTMVKPDLKRKVITAEPEAPLAPPVPTTTKLLAKKPVEGGK